MTDPQEPALGESARRSPPPGSSNRLSSNPPQPLPAPTTTSTTSTTTTPEAIPSILSTWQLTAAQHAQILHNEILPRELYPYLPTPRPAESTNPDTQSRPRRRPLAILILGQTGAGKTRLAPLLLDALQQQQQQPHHNDGKGVVVHLIADTFKTYHPHYQTCLLTHPSHASRLAGSDAAAWLREVCSHAAHAGVDVLVESACRRRGEFEALVRVFSPPHPSSHHLCSASSLPEPPGERAAAGYEYEYDVRVAVLAVPACLSRLGILTRYHRRLPEAGPARGLPVRLTPRGVHDESYAGLAAAVGWLDRQQQDDGCGGSPAVVGRVVVLRRNGLVVYDNQTMEDGQGGKERWRDRLAALEALEMERARGLSREEEAAAEEDLRVLRGLGDPKVDRELDEIERLMTGLRGRQEGVFPDLKPLDVQDFVAIGGER